MFSFWHLLGLTFLAGVLGSPDAPLYLYYSEDRQDNAVYSAERSLQRVKADYKLVRNCSQVVSNSTQELNTIPLYTYYSGHYNDTANVATPDSLAYVEDKGYQYVGIEGYVYFSSPGVESTPLKLYWSEERTDFFLTGCTEDEQSAIAGGYVYVRTEGYVPVVFRAWTSSPPEGCPFKQSDVLTGIEFSYRAGIYGNADTWFPSWGSDDNLYTMWTDGSVNGTSGGNSQHTTGFAVAMGDDPLNQTITNIGTFKSYPDPYKGRYPSANLVYDQYWYYGTYALDNPHIPPDPAPDCGNWCVQGPFIDFRYSPVASPDHPPQWNEPRVFMADDKDNVFQQTSKNNGKVKFGALHVVDFGKELEYSPDKKVYVIGHGATLSTAHESWMQGDEVYLGKGIPDPVQINNQSAWQFYGGVDPEGYEFWVNHMDDARPLFTWNNHTGVTTMTYLPLIKKYIMCVSTPTYSPYTTKEFDTYLLESSNMTGPYSLIAYMGQFGPEAYFVNIPSKFAASGITQVDGAYYYNFYLSYSANFAMHSATPNPPGSGYHWVLMESRFKMNANLVKDFL